jgi:hypothetical protein
VLLSIDEDAKRLQRYLNEMKFPFPVARIAAAEAGQLMGVENTPMTFYVDRKASCAIRPTDPNPTATPQTAWAGTSIN